MTVETSHELFEYHLEELYYVEATLVGVFEDLARSVHDEELAASFENGREECAAHVERIEETFERLDRPPTFHTSGALDALEATLDVLDADANDPGLFDFQRAYFAIHASRAVITWYEQLLELAPRIGFESTDELEANLSEERERLDDLRTVLDDGVAPPDEGSDGAAPEPIEDVPDTVEELDRLTATRQKALAEYVGVDTDLEHDEMVDALIETLELEG